MSIINANLLILLKKVADPSQDWPQLIVIQRHRVDGDNGVVFVLPRGLSAEGDTTASGPIPAMINLQVSNEERPGIHWKVGHVTAFSDWVAVGRRRGSRVFLGVRIGVFGVGR